jgi:predicted TIM-barrel fold metal-dependent hydrolase
MYLFDANCAVGPWPTDRPAYETADELSSVMERLGIERALVSHTLGQTYDPPRANQILMDEIAGHERLLPCWTLLPLSCGEMGTLETLLERMAGSGVRAVRFYPRDHQYELDEWQCGELLDGLSERRYVVLLDVDQTNWGEIERVCRTYPGLSLVLTQTGYRQMRRLMALMARYPNVYCDLSTFCVFLGVEEVLERFGSRRLLFGTGLPLRDPGGPIARVSYVRAAEADVTAIAHGTLEWMLGRVRLQKESA